ncbi:hypothetical protein [Cellulomonas hominis]
MVAEETVDALYRVLLGHPPDPAGLAYWQTVGSVDEIIDALSRTARHAERVLALAEGLEPGRGQSDLVQAGIRLVGTGGLVELVDLPAGVSVHTALEALPWDLLPVGPGARVRVVGRFASELAAELRRRTPGALPEAGVGPEAPSPRTDVLIVTSGRDLGVLHAGRPDVVRAVHDALLVPALVDPSAPADETAAVRDRLRRDLHDLGFLEVTQSLRRRHGAATVILDTTRSTPTPGVLLTTVHSVVEPTRLPGSTWFLARRVAAEPPR